MHRGRTAGQCSIERVFHMAFVHHPYPIHIQSIAHDIVRIVKSYFALAWYPVLQFCNKIPSRFAPVALSPRCIGYQFDSGWLNLRRAAWYRSHRTWEQFRAS